MTGPAPVRVSPPTKSVKFEKDSERGLYRSGVTAVVTARDREGRLVTAHQHFLSLQFNKQQWAEFQKRQTLDIQARLAVPKLEPPKFEAILELSSGVVALGQHEISLSAHEGPGPRLTSILLSSRSEPALRGSGPADPCGPLRGENYQLYLPTEPRFSPSDKLTVCFSILDIRRGSLTGQPHLRLTFEIEQGNRIVLSVSAEEVQVLPATQNHLLVLKQIDLSGLRPRSYTLATTLEDKIQHTSAHQTPSFVVEQDSEPDKLRLATSGAQGLFELTP